MRPNQKINNSYQEKGHVTNIAGKRIQAKPENSIGVQMETSADIAVGKGSVIAGRIGIVGGEI